ncbi:MAG TPA: GNAT family N-acetyltransferase, partial [Thermomicrobiales bacterium]|nr:GNAT family N-acetyltransferase [Thermomicrobiales bacterium]
PSPAVTIRPYQRGDEASLVPVWNRALWSDPITFETWRAKVLLDPNFDPATCLVADVDGVVRGFVLALTRQVPFFNEGLDPTTGWITAFGVDPDFQRQGIGRALLHGVLNQLRELGRAKIMLGPYVPNYFTPGVDVNAYAPAIGFFEKHGFRVTMRPLSMRAILTGFTVPPALAPAYQKLEQYGIDIRPARPDDITPVLQFVRDHFSWDWHREATGVFQDLFAGLGDPRQVGLMVADKDGEIVGYSQHRGERFGPFGVREDRRSQGIGRVLLAEILLTMRAKNFHTAWFLWTSDQAARLYAQCGFEEARRFAVMVRDL